MNKNELIELLNITSLETSQYYELGENDLSKNYGPGKWNIRQILHHLAETEFLLAARLKRIIAEPKQVIWAYDQDAWSDAFHHATAPLDGEKEIYLLFRKMNISLVDQYYEECGNKEFVHSEVGLRTLKMEFDKVAFHNQTHNSQIKLALSI